MCSLDQFGETIAIAEIVSKSGPHAIAVLSSRGELISSPTSYLNPGVTVEESLGSAVEHVGVELRYEEANYQTC